MPAHAFGMVSMCSPGISMRVIFYTYICILYGKSNMQQNVLRKGEVAIRDREEVSQARPPNAAT